MITREEIIKNIANSVCVCLNYFENPKKLPVSRITYREIKELEEEAIIRYKTNDQFCAKVDCLNEEIFKIISPLLEGLE